MTRSQGRRTAHETASTTHGTTSTCHETVSTTHETVSTTHGTVSTCHETVSTTHGTASTTHETVSTRVQAGGHTLVGAGHTLVAGGHTLVGAGHTLVAGGHTLVGAGHALVCAGHALVGRGHTLVCDPSPGPGATRSETGVIRPSASRRSVDSSPVHRPIGGDLPPDQRTVQISDILASIIVSTSARTWRGLPIWLERGRRRSGGDRRKPWTICMFHTIIPTTVASSWPPGW
jgi:hypothetical protein